MSAMFQLSAFGDEISTDLSEQLKVLVGLNVRSLDLRSAFGINVSIMTDEDVSKVRETCADAGVRIACLGSPVGKSQLSAEAGPEIANLTRLSAIADRLGTRYIRVFSFYPDDMSTNEHYDQHVEQSAQRLGDLARIAEKEGVTLVLENEKGIVTDTPERCLAVIQLVNSPALRSAWDPANFIQVGVARPVDRSWAALRPYVGYVHIKDAMLADGRVVPAGEGDGQVPELLQRLKEMNYQGVLSLEPHLKIAGHSSGFSGPEGMALAVNALRGLMSAASCEEVW